MAGLPIAFPFWLSKNLDSQQLQIAIGELIESILAQLSDGS